MRHDKLLAMGSAVVLAAASHTVMSHGLMVDPPARNALCGLDEAPDQATTPACVEAFQNDFSGGYQFMSVLTHDIGRQGGPSTHVCGFDSETWGGGPTPWDVATDWPTTEIGSGPLEITWNISWGPHWADTEEFVYYITKPDFEFDPNQALTWDDFESEPFCVLDYNDSAPNANPNVTPEKSANLFHTRCNVPERTGHHVIYGEWGRNEWTYERFHGCVDVAFAGGNNSSSSVSSSSSESSLSSSESSSSSTESSVSSSSSSSSSIPPYSSSSSSSSSVASDGLATCEHVVANEWNTGFVGAVRITNTSDTTINGWEVNWEYTDGAVITNSWSTALAGSNPYTGANLGWNAVIEPGQTVEFGFQGNKNGGSVDVSDVTGAICD